MQLGILCFSERQQPCCKAVVGLGGEAHQRVDQWQGDVQHRGGHHEGRVAARLPVLPIGLRSVGTLRGLPPPLLPGITERK